MGRQVRDADNEDENPFPGSVLKDDGNYEKESLRKPDPRKRAGRKSLDSTNEDDWHGEDEDDDE